jgi:predicted enzyme related to lactoylglutathione lyase
MKEQSNNQQIKKEKNMSKAKKIGHNVIWFEIPADDKKRAQKFYKSLFGWKINAMPGMETYFHIDTGGPDDSPDGGMLDRMHPGHTITNYINVESVDKFSDKVKKLGGEICRPKTAVPGMGYFAICKDTENNTFAIWEINQKSK